MSDMGDLLAFYSARLDEAEALARAAGKGDDPKGLAWRQYDADRAPGKIIDGHGCIIVYDEGSPTYHEAAHIAAVDPKHRLADIALKRAILAEHARVPAYKPETIALYPDHPEMAEMATCRRCHELDEDAEIDEDRCADLEWPCDTARLLGTEFSDHTDYKAEWAP